MNEKVAINRVNAREGESTVSSENSSLILTTSVLTERKEIMTTATLNIKVIKVHPVTGGNLKAYIDICIDDALIIKGLRVMDGKNGLFVHAVVKNKNDEKYYETVSCTNQEVKDDLTSTVLVAYKNEVK